MSTTCGTAKNRAGNDKSIRMPLGRRRPDFAQRARPPRVDLVKFSQLRPLGGRHAYPVKHVLGVNPPTRPYDAEHLREQPWRIVRVIRRFQKQGRVERRAGMRQGMEIPFHNFDPVCELALPDQLPAGLRLRGRDPTCRRNSQQFRAGLRLRGRDGHGGDRDAGHRLADMDARSALARTGVEDARPRSGPARVERVQDG